MKVNGQIKFKQPYWEIVSFGHNFSSTMINIKIFFFLPVLVFQILWCSVLFFWSL